MLDSSVCLGLYGKCDYGCHYYSGSCTLKIVIMIFAN